MIDDLGKEWVHCYGAEGIETPHIDALARGGMKFTHAYSMAQCTPTRITLFTGQYPWRTGWVNHWDVPRWGVGYFDWKLHVTFSKLLHRTGYACVAAGKWQVNDFRVEPEAMRKHGFDDWCLWTGYETGNPPSARRYWDPYINTPQGSRTYRKEFGPDVYTDYLIRFMRTHREEPMLLYYGMALTHPPLTPTPDQPQVVTNMGRHRAMVRYADKLIGRLVAALEELRLRDRTLVFVTTDNGTSRGITGRRRGREVRGAKGQKSEAGACQPFIVNCPGRVPAGVTTDALTDFSDILPTFAEIAGASIPETWPLDGRSIAPLILGEASDSGRDWILCMGHGPARRDRQGFRGVEDYASRVLRTRRYKAWVNPRRRIDRLYDLREDPFEETNLISAPRPDIRQALEFFEAVVRQMPKNDARPRYRPRRPLPWDKPYLEP